MAQAKSKTHITYLAHNRKGKDMSEEVKKEIEKPKESTEERHQRINDNFCGTAFKFLVAINESNIIISDQEKHIYKKFKEINKALTQKIQYMQANRDISADNTDEDNAILELMDTYLKSLTISREKNEQIIKTVGD